MHTAFARFCIKANCYRDALSILDIDIFDFPTSRASKDIDFGGKGFEVAYQDVLQYYLYGAMLYMGMKKWRRSLDYLAHVCGRNRRQFLHHLLKFWIGNCRSCIRMFSNPG
jgi:COP9 signalosome complex subunit 3